MPELRKPKRPPKKARCECGAELGEEWAASAVLLRGKKPEFLCTTCILKKAPRLLKRLHRDD